jgi:hypothetical protein
MADRADHVTAPRDPAASRRDGAGRGPCVVPTRIGMGTEKATGRVRDGAVADRTPVCTFGRSKPSFGSFRRLR